MLKTYISRVTSKTKKIEFVYWWIIRLTMLGGIIYRLIEADPALGFYQPLQMFANLAGMFAFELFQAMPEKNLFRHVPAYCQDVSVISLFLASFGGAFLNFYYSIWWWDTALHLVGGAQGVILGYELVCAMQKRDKKYCSLPVILLCALGISFVGSTAWELFEFTFDQLGNGDSQHWSFVLAEQAGDTATVFPLVDPQKFALMDTMTDIVFNTIGAAIAYVILRIFPYKHRGENDLNKQFGEPSKEKKEKSCSVS